MSAKNYQKAIDCYSKAIEIDGSNPIYYGNRYLFFIIDSRAAAYASLGKPNDSLADAQKALEIDPSYTKAYSRLGHAYFSLEKYEDSVQAYQKALEADPNNANLRASLSTAQDKLKSVSKSAQGGEANESPSGMPSGMPDLGGMDLGAMMNNPGFMDMGNLSNL
jgi:small glutamine-rich tetratricopeptide repeat-containing protein alpha